MSNTPQNQIMLSADPVRAVRDMLTTINDLSIVYERETKALEESDTDTFLSLQDEKLEKARRYEAGIGELLARKDDLKKLSAGLKDQLNQKQKHFATLAKRNLEALSRMQRSIERLGNTMRNAAKDAARKDRTFSYGENGLVQVDDKKPVSTGLSETA